MRTRTLLTLATALLALGAAPGCREPGPGGRPAGEGPDLLHGRVVDAETGAPISRAHLYLHFFCDEIGHQTTLDPADTTEYAVHLPRATVRIRAFDTTEEHHLLETTLTLDGDDRAFDIALRPTHFVLLRGRVIDGATGKSIVPTTGMGAGPLLYVSAADDSWQARAFVPEADGTFTLRAPRTRLVVRAVNTPGRVRTETLDLTGETAAERAVEIALE